MVCSFTGVVHTNSSAYKSGMDVKRSVLAEETTQYVDLDGSGEKTRVVTFQSPFGILCRIYLKRNSPYNSKGTLINEPRWEADEVLICDNTKFIVYDNRIIVLPNLPVTEGAVQQLKKTG